MHKRRKKILLASLLLISGSFLSGAALLVADGLRDDIHPADVAIVLGNTVESDGRPSARLRARLDKAVELYRGGLFQHVIDGRFVRWLLMFQDRAEADEFELTHEFMAEMLGVPRSSVGEAARKLQEMGLVSYDRGRFRIINRAAMEQMACECYEVVRDEYDSLYKNSSDQRT